MTRSCAVLQQRHYLPVTLGQGATRPNYRQKLSWDTALAEERQICARLPRANFGLLTNPRQNDSLGHPWAIACSWLARRRVPPSTSGKGRQRVELQPESSQ